MTKKNDKAKDAVAQDTPTPGLPLSGEDVGLLKRGDVLRHPKWGLAQYDPQDEDYITGPWTFIGRPGADGWINAPEGGWATDPTFGIPAEFRFHPDADVLESWFGAKDYVGDNPQRDIIAWKPKDLPTDRRAEAEEVGAYAWLGAGGDIDAPPSAGPDAGLETVAWRWERFDGHYVVNPGQPKPCNAEPLVTRQSAAAALEAAAERERELRAERDQVAGNSIWWKAVIGDGTHEPSGEIPSIKHLHPAMVKPIYEAHKGTAVADVIAGLIFSHAITENREQFLVTHANDRATRAEARVAEMREALEEIAANSAAKGWTRDYARAALQQADSAPEGGEA